MSELSKADIERICGECDVRENERGNTIYSGHTINHWNGDDSRYPYDATLLRRGFKQYDTENDAWYFGTWVHIRNRQVFTYAEGDVSLVVCPTLDSFRAELAHMADFYGEAPPAFRCIDADGTVTHVYDERPTV